MYKPQYCQDKVILNYSLVFRCWMPDNITRIDPDLEPAPYGVPSERIETGYFFI